MVDAVRVVYANVNDGQLKRTEKHFFREDAKLRLFNVRRISEAMDNSGTNALSKSGVEVFCGMDTDRQKGMAGMIPSRSAIRFEELDVKSGMDDLMETKVDGIIAVADFTQVLTFLIVNSGLRSRGRTREQIEDGNSPPPISIDITQDGAEKTKSTSMNICLMKITDYELVQSIGNHMQRSAAEWERAVESTNPAGAHSLLGMLLLAYCEGPDDLFHSRAFSEKIYERGEHYGQKGNFFPVKFDDDGAELLFQMKICLPHDMKALQTLSGYGGGSAIKTYFCHCCASKNTERG